MNKEELNEVINFMIELGKKRMLDIVEIKVAKYLKFFIEDKYIYCENIVTGERVIVGEIDAED